MQRDVHYIMNRDTNFRLVLRNNKNLIGIIFLLITCIISFTTLGGVEFVQFKDNLDIQTSIIEQLISGGENLAVGLNDSITIFHLLCDYTLCENNSSCILQLNKHPLTSGLNRTLDMTNMCLMLTTSGAILHSTYIKPWSNNENYTQPLMVN